MDTKKSDEIPVSKKMLEATRDELKSDISSVKLEVQSVRHEVESVRHEVESVRSEVESVRSEVQSVRHEMKAGFDDVQSGMQKLTAAVHRSLALHEDQNARNKYVLDGHQNLHDRQDRIEEKFDTEIRSIKQMINKANSTN